MSWFTAIIAARRIAGSPSLEIGGEGFFVGADCLKVGHIISSEAAKKASGLLQARPWIGQLEGATAQEYQTANDLRGIGWLVIMNVRSEVKNQFKLHPQATNVLASIMEGR